MKKTKDITKYDPEWQFVRISVKGSDVSIQSKIEIVNNYLKSNYTADAFERVLNWFEGLYKGLIGGSNNANIQLVADEINRLKALPPITARESKKTPEGILNVIKQHSFEDRKKLWVDLFKRQKGWGKYIHEEQNEFMKILGSTFSPEEIAQLQKNKMTFDDYVNMIMNPSDGNWKGVY